MTATMKSKSIAVLLCAAALVSCDYEKNAVQDITGLVPEAQIKFFNFGLDAPGVNFYANDTKMTAILSSTGTESTAGVTYGGVGAAGLYTGIAPGQYTLSGRIAATVDKDLPVSNLTATIETGKFYSFYQTGPYNSATKTVDAFIVEDPFPAVIDWSAADVRFVHAIHNANPMTLFATHQTTGEVVTIGGPTAYKAAGAFTAVLSGVYNISTRYEGVATDALTRTAVSFVAGRVYTITARGDILVAPSTTTCGSANRTCLDNTLNR